MDAIGIIKPVSPQVAAPIAHADPAPAVSGTTDTADTANTQNDVQTAYDAQAAERRRMENVQRLAQGIANVYVVSDQKFTIFKDSSGQYITRFTNLRSGKVTYIPEPSLLRMSSSSAGLPPTVTIKA